MDMPLKEVKAELLKHNNYLPHFPVPNDRKLVESLPDDKLVKIIDRAKRVEWQHDVLTANIDPYSMKLDEYYKYLKKLKIKHWMENASQKLKEGKNANQEKKRAKSSHNNSNRPSKRPKKGKGDHHKTKVERKEA